MLGGELSDNKSVEIDAKNERKRCVKVFDEKSGEAVEMPVEREVFLSLATLTAAFPGATGLKFETETGLTRELNNKDGGKIFAPSCYGFGDRTYKAVFPQVSSGSFTKKSVSTDLGIRSHLTPENYCKLVSQHFQQEMSQAIQCYACAVPILCEIPLVKSQQNSGQGFSYVALCSECLKIFKNSRSAKEINDLSPETLTQIFRHLPPQFWLKVLRSVCKLWQEVIEEICASISSIEFVEQPEFHYKCQLFIPTLCGDFSHQNCTTNDVCYYINKSRERLEKFVMDCGEEEPSLDSTPMLRVLESCQNLTSLSLTYSVHFHIFDVFRFPHLRTFALELQNVRFNDEMAQMQSHLARFLFKHRKISDLSISGFNPGNASFTAIGILSLEKFRLVECFEDSQNFQPMLLDSVGRSAESLEHLDLEICAPYDWPANQAALFSFFEKLREGQTLTSLHLIVSTFCAKKFLLCEIIALGLAKLSGLKTLHLNCFVFDFPPESPLNIKKLTAAKLLASTFANLAEICLKFHHDSIDVFLVEVFNFGQPKLKRLIVDSFGVSEFFGTHVTRLCPNLEYLWLYPGGIKFCDCDILREIHRNVHKCQREGAAAADSVNAAKQRKKLRIAKIGKHVNFEKIRKLRLCGLKVENKEDISIYRNFCTE